MLRDLLKELAIMGLVFYIIFAAIALIIGMAAGCPPASRWNMPLKRIMPTYAVGCWLITPIKEE